MTYIYTHPLTSERYISHHGILGQKWGVRRFQNEDGSLTSAGMKRYKVSSKEEYDKKYGTIGANKKISRKKMVKIGDERYEQAKNSDKKLLEYREQYQKYSNDYYDRSKSYDQRMKAKDKTTIIANDTATRMEEVRRETMTKLEKDYGTVRVAQAQKYVDNAPKRAVAGMLAVYGVMFAAGLASAIYNQD